ncbi:hypothetical protein AALD74_15150 [Lachnospiraceae bacterium 48-21]
MAVLRKILSFIITILAVVGKLFYVTVILMFRLFLLALQMVLVIFHGGNDI